MGHIITRDLPNLNRPVVTPYHTVPWHMIRSPTTCGHVLDHAGVTYKISEVSTKLECVHTCHTHAFRLLHMHNPLRVLVRFSGKWLYIFVGERYVAS